MQSIRYRSLDAFRGIAALLVLLFHSPFYFQHKLAFIENSDIFVDFFFILSGFVLTHTYLAQYRNLTFKQFALKRFARLYPLHIFILALFALFLLFKLLAIQFISNDIENPFIKNNLVGFLSHATLLNAHNLTSNLSWNAPAWSIGAEFSTYLLFYALVIMFLSRNSNKLLILLSCTAIAYTCLFTLTDKTLLQTYKLGVIRAASGFFLGASSYYISKQIPFKNNKVKDTLIEVLILIIVVVAVSYLTLYKPFQLLLFLLFALVVIIFSNTKGLISMMLNHAGFQWLGKHSYSIYMNHLLIITICSQIWQLFNNSNKSAFNTPLALYLNIGLIALTILSAYFTYRFIEFPCYQKANKALAMNSSKK